jgi:hypothetical protein
VNYVLTEQTMQWLRAQMARSGAYTPAAQTPSRQVKRDVAPSGSPKFQFAYKHAFDPENDEHTVTIGEGAVQIGGVTYLFAGGEVEDVGEGTQYICLHVDVENGSAIEYYEAYASIEEINEAQEDGAYESEYGESGFQTRIFPLYRIEDYAVKLDMRPLLTADVKGVTSLNELIGDLTLEAGDGVDVGDTTIYPLVEVDEEDGKTIKISLTDEQPPDPDHDDENDGYCNDISGDGGEGMGGGNDISGGGGEGEGGGNSISKDPCRTGEASS